MAKQQTSNPFDESAPIDGEVVTTALATVDNHAALMIAPEELESILAENLGAGESLSINSLDKYIVPGGSGAAVWNIISGGKDPEAAPPPEGIVIYHQKNRAMWLKERQGGQSGPPDCVSPGENVGSQTVAWINARAAELGIKNANPLKSLAEGGLLGQNPQPCLTCPFSKFGTGKNGRGQKCTLKRNVFIMRPDKIRPAVIQVPTKSLANFLNYASSLIDMPARLSEVVTVARLSKAQGQEGPYYQIQFSMAAHLNEPTAARYKQMRENLAPIFEQANAALTMEDVQPPVELD